MYKTTALPTELHPRASESNKSKLLLLEANERMYRALLDTTSCLLALYSTRNQKGLLGNWLMLDIFFLFYFNAVSNQEAFKLVALKRLYFNEALRNCI